MTNVNLLSDLEPADRRYSAVAQNLHWLTAALMVAVVVIAWTMVDLPRTDPARGQWTAIHKSIGVTILVLSVLRLLWRQIAPAPLLGHRVPQAQQRLATAVHILLYLVLLVMPISGYVGSVAGGHPVSFFGLVAVPDLIGQNENIAHAAHAVHEVGQWAVYVLVALHVLGALYHALFRRDGVLRRMLPHWLAP